MSKENEPRERDKNDYDRPQPTSGDAEIISHFLNREFGGSAAGDFITANRPYIERKLGLILAAQFNRGYESGVAAVRKENGYAKGYEDALLYMRAALDKLAKGEP